MSAEGEENGMGQASSKSRQSKKKKKWKFCSALSVCVYLIPQIGTISRY